MLLHRACSELWNSASYCCGDGRSRLVNSQSSEAHPWKRSVYVSCGCARIWAAGQSQAQQAAVTPCRWCIRYSALGTQTQEPGPLNDPIQFVFCLCQAKILARLLSSVDTDYQQEFLERSLSNVIHPDLRRLHSLTSVRYPQSSVQKLILQIWLLFKSYEHRGLGA